MSCPGVKLWVGNLDRQLTEYQLLKICEKFGEVVTFDFLYHISDTGHRSPRGYAFVTFANSASADAAVSSLQGKRVLGRELLVRYANPRSEGGIRPMGRPIPTALKLGGEGGTEAPSETEKACKIRALEAKLKSMQGSSPDFRLQQPSAPSSSRPKPYSRK